jgi:hypothetical protein
MVKSLINSSIDYPENKTLYNEDREYEASLYKLELLGEEVIISLGQAKYTYIDNDIIFYPIYLIKNNRVDVQIGVYEVETANSSSILDEDGDVDISQLNEPLLYPFVSKAVLSDKFKQASIEEVEEPIEAEIITFKEQTLEDAVKEREAFKDNKDLPWIQRFMKNNNYKIIDNEGGGECLFAAIRDGLKMVGVNTSVNDMRKILAENATNELFLNYKNIYDNSVQEDKQLSREIKILGDRHTELKKQMKIEKDRATQTAIVAQAEEIAERHKILKKDRAETRVLLEEFKFIKGIKDLDMFKLKIQTCDFWGDTWAISTLERALNIKLVLMSRNSFKGNDIDNVLTCGQLNDELLETSGRFEPNYYIILDYSGAHYQLITYKDKGAFTFKELPYDIKMLVVDKCLERQAGPYYIIPDFKAFMEKIDIKLSEDDEIKTVEMQSDLYDNATVFQFYSKSLDSVAPGKGSGESIGPEGTAFYSELAKIPSWRKKLSNFWESEFTLDGKKWLSVEHYYQGSKFKRSNPNYYAQFSLDSGSALSKDTAMAKGAGGKSGKYKGTVIRPKEVTIDKDFFEVRKDGLTRSNLEMQAAMMAKFSQNEELNKLLKATKKAKLNHFSRGSPPVLFTELMIVRKQLNEMK